MLVIRRGSQSIRCKQRQNLIAERIVLGQVNKPVGTTVGSPFTRDAPGVQSGVDESGLPTSDRDTQCFDDAIAGRCDEQGDLGGCTDAFFARLLRCGGQRHRTDSILAHDPDEAVLHVDPSRPDEVLFHPRAQIAADPTGACPLSEGQSRGPWTR